MELIDLYAAEVGRRLPEKMRADIEQEIRSMIEDMLEDESQTQGKPVDEALAAEVLKRLGPPEKMAASYLPPRYLIGPELFPAFLRTLRVVLPIILVGTVVSLGLSLGLSVATPLDIGRAFGEAVSNLITSIFYSVGIIIIIFAMIQWVGPQARTGGRAPQKAAKEWDPLKLKAQPDPEVVKPTGMIVEAVLTLAAMVLFNGFSQDVGMGILINGKWIFTPVLAPIFFQYLPWMDVLWALTVGLKLVVASQGKWQAATRWGSTGLTLFNLVLIGRILTGPALITVQSEALAGLAPMLNSLANAGLQIALGITVIVLAVEVAKNLYRLLIKGPFSRVVGA